MRFKFLTLNILHGGVIWDNLINFLRNEDPDIAVFQEVYNSKNESLDKRFRTIEEFKKELPNLKYSVFEPTITDSSTKSPWGNAIFSKFEILDSKNYIFNPGITEYSLEINDGDPSNVPEGVLETSIKINGKYVTVCSWHGVWDKHGRDTPARDKMGEILISALKNKSPLILAGDTNLNPDTEFVKKIERELTIQNIFGTSLKSTFNMLHKEDIGYASAVVDMIFVSKDIKVLNKYMSMDDVSDHRPLVATLEI